MTIDFLVLHERKLLIFKSEVRQEFMLWYDVAHVENVVHIGRGEVVDVRKSVHSSRPSEQNYPLDY